MPVQYLLWATAYLVYVAIFLVGAIGGLLLIACALVAVAALVYLLVESCPWC
jgi:hypothetical protein